MSKRCPVCLEPVSDDTVVWVTGDGHVSDAPPPTRAGFVDRLRRRLGLPDPYPAQVADFYARGNQARCSRGHTLPREYLVRQSYVIGLVGESGSSKSHYIAALLRSMQQGDLGSLSMHVDFEAETTRRFNSEYYSSLFGQQRVIPATRPRRIVDESTGIHEDRAPLALVLRNWDTDEAVNLYLFDVAGEQLVDEQKQATWARHLALADGLMFFVDPAVLRDLPGGPAGDDSGRGQTLHVTETIISATAALARLGRGIGHDSNLDSVASAVLVSKADLLESRAAFPSGVLRPLDYDRETPATLGARLRHDSVLVERFLELAGARNLVMGTLNKFPTTQFFAVTATGTSAKEGRYATVAPRRCLEPLLAILHQLGVVRLGDQAP